MSKWPIPKTDSLHKLINKVENDYSLHLDEYHGIDSAPSDQSVGWFLGSLDKDESLHIVGGSVHVEDAYSGNITDYTLFFIRMVKISTSLSILYLLKNELDIFLAYS